MISAINVYFSDRDKIESIIMSAKRIANTLDEAEELDKLLDRLVKDDAKKRREFYVTTKKLSRLR